ncbi:MAG: hypothetical protein R3C44_14250 [Chloroflexota bacterium]
MLPWVGANLLATEAGTDAIVVDLQDTGLGQVTYDTEGGVLEVSGAIRLTKLGEFLAAAELPGDLPVVAESHPTGRTEHLSKRGHGGWHHLASTA